MEPETVATEGATAEGSGPEATECAKRIPDAVIFAIVAEKCMTAALLLKDLDREREGAAALVPIPALLTPMAPEGATGMSATLAGLILTEFADGCAAVASEEGEDDGR